MTVMAKGEAAEEFVLRSGVRSGLKREFAFAIKAQAAIQSPLSRTRSGKSSPRVLSVSAKRPRKSTPQEEPPKPDAEAFVDVLVVDGDRDGLKKDLGAENRVSGGVNGCRKVEMDMVGAEAEVVPEVVDLEALEEGRTVETMMFIDKGFKEDPAASSIEKPARRLASAALSWTQEESVVEGLEIESSIATHEDRKVVNGRGEEEAAFESLIETDDQHVSEVPARLESDSVCSEPAGERTIPSTGEQTGSLHTPMEVSSLDSKVDGGAFGKPVRRFTRSALKMTSLEAQEAKTEMPIDEKSDGVMLFDCSQPEYPIRRITRSLVKVSLENSAAVSISNDVSNGSEETNTANGSLGTSPKKKMELKMSKKIGLTKLPTNVRDLLATGLLDGLSVKYISSIGKQVGLLGMIKDGSILCSCSSCKGSKAFSAYQFEIHAGSTKKHPSDFIFLENGNSLRDVLKACSNAPLDMLQAAIQNAIGPQSEKVLICQKCNVSFHTSRTGKFSLLCDACLQLKQFQPTPSQSNKSTKISRLSEPVSVSSSSDSTSECAPAKPCSRGRLTRKDLGLHKLVFNGILPDGTEVGYYVRGKRLLEGYIKDSGIYCLCCSAVVSPSQFEAHAGRAARRKPYNNIYTSNGVSLHELSVSLAKARKLSTIETDDLCSFCADGGNLLLCDLCPRAFHLECAGLAKIPNGEWHCQFCENLHQREKCLERNDNAIAAGRVDGVDPIEQIFKRCIRIVKTSETDVGSCVLCRCHDFSTSGFNPRTVLICDQCEKEYHVGCLKERNMADLKGLPECEWFCSSDCNRIYTALQKLLLHGSEQLQDWYSDFIKRKRKDSLLEDSTFDVRWRLLSGKFSSPDSDSLLSQALSIFHESFDPILDPLKGCNLIPYMVYGKSLGDQDFGGMYCAVLTVNSSVVSTCVLRVLGCEVAELALAATQREGQGKGYFQSLFSRIERMLGSMKVKHFVLAAAHEAESIWTKKFGFAKITNSEQLHGYTQGARPFLFQGTAMLHKLIPQ